MTKDNHELNAAYDEYERLEAIGKYGKPGWTDPDFYAHFAKMDAQKELIENLKRKAKRPSTLPAKPMAITYDIPPPLDLERSYYRFEDLEINGSFAVAMGREYENAKSAISIYKRRHPGWNYVSRVQPDGTARFWRTA